MVNTSPDLLFKVMYIAQKKKTHCDSKKRNYIIAQKYDCVNSSPIVVAVSSSACVRRALGTSAENGPSSSTSVAFVLQTVASDINTACFEINII
jgi:hypothetical protein